MDLEFLSNIIALAGIILPACSLILGFMRMKKDDENYNKKVIIMCVFASINIVIIEFLAFFIRNL